MQDDTPQRRALTDADRQRAVDALCQAFADDRIQVEDFERRVEVAHRAETIEELTRLLQDVPGPPPPVRRDPGSASPSVSPAATFSPYSLVESGPHPLQVPEAVRPTSFIAGIMGAGTRVGAWHPARINYAMGLMGGFSLDLRESPLPPGETEIKIFCMWGGGEIIVPPGVRVEASVAGILGGFEYDHAVPGTLDPAAPVVRVTGVCFMGGAEVVVRYPGETARDARQRRRSEKKARRKALKEARRLQE